MTGTQDPSQGERRFLLTGVVSRYMHQPAWNREELADDRKLVIDLFSELGYEHVPLLGLDPTWYQLQETLRDFSTDRSRQPEDYIAVYLAGHGDVLPVGVAGTEHVLLPADARPSDPYRNVVKSADLAHLMLAGTKVHRLLLLVDTCFSGHGGLDFAANASAWAGTWGRLDTPDPAGVVVISATQPKQEALPGKFTAALDRAVRSPATAGHLPSGRAIDAVVGVMNADPDLPETQRAQWAMVAGNGAIPDFLPNLRRETVLADLNLAEQARWLHWRQQEESRRTGELKAHFAPRITGFIGRAQALADISCWLDDAGDLRPAVVTGDPGSGKSTVLGMMAALSDPERRPTVPRDGLPAGIVRRPRMIDVAVYAGNLTADQVLSGLAAAAGLDDLNPDPAAFDSELALFLNVLGDRKQPLTAVVDALDEASDPADLVDRLLRPLIERGKRVIRLLLGSRRPLCLRLGPAWPDSCLAVDLDTPHYADPASMLEVVRQTLRYGGPSQKGTSPFAVCPPDILQKASAAIAETARRSFFVARILASAEAARSALPDVADPAWLASLPSEAGQAMKQDLEIRLRGDAGRAISLLRPLAYAQGAGMPWEDIWADLASALDSAERYTNDDLLELSVQAGAYIVESGVIEGRSLYRLYHRSLAEYLLEGRDQHADQHAITIGLTGHVPLRSNARRNWPAAHPYIRAFLTAHARAGGLIDEYSQDPGFLMAASPSGLLKALAHASTAPARAAADAYRRALPFLRTRDPAEHPAYLALAARCGRAPTLADRVTADDFTGTWHPLWAAWKLRRPHQVVSGHRGPVLTVAGSELQGRTVVISGSSDSTLRAWDLVTGAPVGAPLTGHDGAVNTVAAAELDGRPVIVSGSEDRTVRVWDLATGTPIGKPLTGHRGLVRSLVVSELGGRSAIISGSEDRTVRVWDLTTGTPIGKPLTGHSGHVGAVAAAELDGRPVVVSGGEDRTVRVWDPTTGTQLGAALTGHDGAVKTVATTELDGRQVVVSGSSDRTVRVWDPVDPLVGEPFAGHDGSVNAVATGELESRPVIISGGGDGSLRVWDLATGTQLRAPLTGHKDWVRAVAVSELDGRQVIISGGEDQTLRIWDLATGTPIGKPLTGHDGAVNTVAAAELDGRPVVVSGSSDSTLRVWDLATDSPVGSPITGHRDWVRAVTVCDLGGRPFIISGSEDRTVRVWDLASHTPAGPPFTGHGGAVSTVAAAELDGRPVVASGGEDRTVRVWDLATGTPIGAPLTGHSWTVNALAAGGLDGRPVIVSGSEDHRVRVWDLATGTLVGAPFTGHDGAVNTVATAELDGRPVIVSGGDDWSVQVWDLVTGAPVGAPLTGHDGAVNTVAAAELDGRPVIVSGSEDRTVRVWDLATGTPIGKPFSGHDGAVKAVAMGELESRPAIISGSSDGSLRVWDLATGTPIGKPLTGHSGHVLAVAIGALDGQPIVVSGSSDHTVRVWDLGACTTLGPPFIGHHAPVTTVVVDELASRPIIISGSQDRTVRVWDLAVSGSVIKTYSLPGEVRSVVCTGGDQWATPAVRQVACAADRAVFLSPLEPERAGTEEPVADVQFSGRIISAAWHPLGALALGTEDGIAVIRMTRQEVN